MLARDSGKNYQTSTRAVVAGGPSWAVNWLHKEASLFQVHLGRNKSTHRPRHLGNRHLRDCSLWEARRPFKVPQVLLLSASSSDTVDWVHWYLRDFIEFRGSFEVILGIRLLGMYSDGSWRVTKICGKDQK